MSDYNNNLIGSINGMFNEKLIKQAIISAILFYIVSNPKVVEFVDSKMYKVGIKLSANNLLILRSIIFSVILVFTVRYVFIPLIDKV
jgi:hypothetical protein